MNRAPREIGACFMKKLVFVIFLMIFFVLVGCQKNQEVKVTFETNGGTSINEVNSIDELLLGIPTTTKEGYTFKGWYTDQSLTEEFDPLEERDSWVITIYAKWDPNDKNYVVEHYKEGLDGVYVLFEDEDLVGKTGDVITATPKTYEGFSVDNSHANSISELTLPASGNAVLKLYYERNTYQIIIDEAGGTEVSDLNVLFGETIVLPTLTKFGHTFVGWSSYPSTMPSNDLEVSATWEELPKYNVAFNSNGGSSVSSQSIYQGYLADEPNDPTKIGYMFTGWFKDDVAFSFSTPVTQATTLIAHWTPVEVDYHTEVYVEALNGSYTLNQTITLKALTESTVNASPISVPGFTIDNTNANRISSGTVLGDGSLTLKIYYTRNSYTIQFEANANLSIQSIVAKYDEVVDQPQNPIRNNYTFVGWYSDSNLSVPYTFTTMPLGGITLYAKWLGQPTTLYFNSNEGSSVESITAPLGDVITEPNAPTKEGYTFAGWYTNVGLTEAFTTWMMPTGGITLYAKWTPNLYTITFEENGGSTVLNIEAGYKANVSVPASPTKEDYIFIGWYLDVNLTTEYTFTTMPLGGITLYAKWVTKEEGLSLLDIKKLDYYTSVHVEGLVFIEASTPYQGFYITDGTANIYVLYDQSLVTDGLNYGFDALLVYQQGMPMLAQVSNLETIMDTYTVVPSTPLEIDDLKTLDLETVHYEMIELVGILLEDDGYVLADLDSGTRIHISDKFSLGDVSASLMNKVKVDAILYQHQGAWIIEVTNLENIGLTDLDKVELIKAYIDSYVDDSYQGMDHFDLLMNDPWGLSQIVMSFDIEDEKLYDYDYLGFVHTEGLEVISLTSEITLNDTVYEYVINFNLVPRIYDTVLDVINGDVGETFNLKGLMVMAYPDEEVYILKDSTGTIFIRGHFEVTYGDEVAVEVKKDVIGKLCYGIHEEFYQIISRFNDIDPIPNEITMTDYANINLNDPMIYSQYYEIRGFLSDQSELEHSDHFAIGNDSLQVIINPITYNGFESLFDYAGLEVLLRGYLILSEQGIPMMIFAGEREEIKIPNYSDTERVEMILELFSRNYADHTFTSYETFVMADKHPMLGGHITWNFVEGESYYDEVNQWFTFVDNPKTIKIELNISYHDVTRSYVYQTMLEGPEILSIAEFKQHPSYENAFVEGVVVYRNPNRMYIQDETGLLFVNVYDCDAYVGDHVVVYGYLYRDYEFENRVEMNYQYRENGQAIPHVVYYYERDLTPEIPVNQMTISDVNELDPNLLSSYNQMIEITGYLTAIVEDEYLFFTLQYGTSEIDFDTIDEYTMYKLGDYRNKHVKIQLMIEDYDDNTWDLMYLGIKDDIEEISYSLTEKQDILKSIVNDIWVSPMYSGTSRSLPSSYSPFNASYTYDVPTDYEAIFDLLFAYVYPVDEEMTIPLSVFITVDEVTIEHIINVNVLPKQESSTILNITQAKEKLDEVVTIGGKIYATFAYDYTYDAILLFDGTDYLIVKLTENDYIYGGSDIGRDVEITGSMAYEDGRYTFVTLSWKILDYAAVPVLTVSPLATEALSTLDHSKDDYLGNFVEVSGTLNRVGWNYYELIKGDTHIRIQTVYYGETSLEPYVGFDITLQGFILGNLTFEESTDIALIMGHAIYNGELNIALDEPDDQVVAEKLVDYFMNLRYDEPYYEGSYINLALVHNLFGDAIVTYTVLDHSELLERTDYEFIVGHASVDTVIPIRLQVDYKMGSASYIFEVLIKGFTYDTLDHLFDESVDLDEINLEATVIYADFDYLYVTIDGEVYYYDGHGGNFFERGQVILINGIKSMINGEVNYSYKVTSHSLNREEGIVLEPRSMTIDEIYSKDLDTDDIRRDYLSVYGLLGYDPYLDYFYLDDMGMRIYIRHHLKQDEAYKFGSKMMKKTDTSKYVMMTYLDDYVILNVLFPNKVVLGEYYLVDFVGTQDDIMLPEHDLEEKIEITKHKIDTRYNALVYHPGDYIDWMYYDPIQLTEVTYTLVDPICSAILLDEYNMQVMIVNEYTTVEVLATIRIYDELIDDFILGTTTFTVYVDPIEVSTVREVLFGRIGEVYVTEGIIQYLYPDYFMIIKDDSGLIYVELPYGENNPFNLEIGDEVQVLGTRENFRYEDYVPIMGTAIDINILSEDNPINRTAISMNIDDILALDYLDPDTFNKYISFDGMVIFSGNTSYPSYDVREDGYADEAYDLQLYGDTYDPYNDMMDSKVGSHVVVYGYLIGFEYVYQEFDWIMHTTEIVDLG